MKILLSILSFASIASPNANRIMVCKESNKINNKIINEGKYKWFDNDLMQLSWEKNLQIISSIVNNSVIENNSVIVNKS